MNAKNSFYEEVNGVSALIQNLGLDVIQKHTPIKFFNYKEMNVVGLQITTTGRLFTNHIYVSFSEKCTSTLEDMCKTKVSLHFQNDADFYTMILSVLNTLVELQKHNIGHGDLKPGNIMICQNSWKLIDWNMYRKLELSILMEKDGILPKHRGSSPFYYMLHDFTYRDIMIKNYVNDFMMAQFHPDMYEEFFSYMKKSVTSFANESSSDKETLFHKFKNHGDLHSLGLVIYAINKLYYNNNTKLEEFSERLCINNESIILNAVDALTAFAKLISNLRQAGGKSRIRYENRTKKSLIELAKVRKLQIPKNATKTVIIEMLRGGNS
jgi:serine/threonine protein kinase